MTLLELPTGDPIEILLVEDNPGDVRLTEEALKESKVRNTLHVARDGVEAIEFLRGRDGNGGGNKPEIILLDLNLRRMNGREVLVTIKTDPDLRRIPVVVLTTSRAEQDILETYDLHANCYIVKPVGLDEFITIVRSVEDFWLSIVRMPPR